jgi:hypothetical protein
MTKELCIGVLLVLWLLFVGAIFIYLTGYY